MLATAARGESLPCHAANGNSTSRIVQGQKQGLIMSSLPADGRPDELEEKRMLE
jgi:hypothetical protein